MNYSFLQSLSDILNIRQKYGVLDFIKSALESTEGIRVCIYDQPRIVDDYLYQVFYYASIYHYGTFIGFIVWEPEVYNLTYSPKVANTFLNLGLDLEGYLVNKEDIDLYIVDDTEVTNIGIYWTSQSRAFLSDYQNDKMYRAEFKQDCLNQLDKVIINNADGRPLSYDQFYGDCTHFLIKDLLLDSFHVRNQLRLI